MIDIAKMRQPLLCKLRCHRWRFVASNYHGRGLRFRRVTIRWPRCLSVVLALALLALAGCGSSHSNPCQEARPVACEEQKASREATETVNREHEEAAREAKQMQAVKAEEARHAKETAEEEVDDGAANGRSASGG